MHILSPVCVGNIEKDYPDLSNIYWSHKFFHCLHFYMVLPAAKAQHLSLSSISPYILTSLVSVFDWGISISKPCLNSAFTLRYNMSLTILFSVNLLYNLFSRKKPLWPESMSELYQPSDRRLSEKLVPTFADRGCHVVSVTDPYGRILGFLDRHPNFSFK
jgi:hypothetical protein